VTSLKRPSEGPGSRQELSQRSAYTLRVELILVLIVALAAVAGIAIFAMLQRSAPPADVAAPLAEMARAMQGLQVQSAAIAEKVGGLGDRVGLLEQHQAQTRTAVAKLDSGLAQATTLTTGLRDATETIRGELAKARDGLTDLQSAARARYALEQETAQSIRRLEQVMAGTAAKGAAGENLVDLVFSRLPAEWQERDFRIGNRTCEFALRLPNELVLPIDSKWPATGLLEQFLASEDPAERARIKSQIEAAVREKAKEVKKYLHPELTVNFGVAVVPDAVFELCTAAQAECMRESVVVVGYSMFVPYLLLVFQTVLRTSRDIDIEKLAGHISVAETSLRALQEEIEGRLSRAITMLTNSRDDLRSGVSKASTSVAAIQARAQLDDDEPLQLPAFVHAGEDDI